MALGNGNRISIPGLPPPTKTGRLAQLLAGCHDDPDRFASVILGEKPFDPAISSSPFWHRQTELGRLITRHYRTVAPWGNSLGKSHFIGRVALWWLCTRQNALVVTTAPSHTQLATVLWKNIRSAAAGSAYPLGLHITKSPLSATLSTENTILGISTNKVERLSGFHSGNVLVLVDEASGIHPEIWAAIDSLAAHKIVLIGNPIRFDGQFKELYEQALLQADDTTIPDEERTVALRVPSTDSPDINKSRSDYGLATGAWIRDMVRKYGENSLWVRTHIHAQFPEAAQDTLIPKDWLQRATNPEWALARRTQHPGKVRIGCDLGEGVGRDKSVILVRDDLGILEVWSENLTDLAGTAFHYNRLVMKYQVELAYRTFDVLGIGKDFPHHLQRYKLTARPYDGSASGGPHHTNLRTACAWALRQRLEPNFVPRGMQHSQPPFHIPAQAWWPSLLEELSTLSYEQVGSKNKLILKKDHKAILGRSPDYMDALLQTWSIGIAQS